MSNVLFLSDNKDKVHIENKCYLLDSFFQNFILVVLMLDCKI